MTLSGIILRSLRRSSAASIRSLSLNNINHHLHSQSLHPLASLIPSRSFAYSSAEEAAAERRRRKRRLRIEPPLHALQRDPNAPRPVRDPNQPETTSALVGPRLSLHNRVQSLIRAGDLDNASLVARQAVFSRTRPTVFTCNAIIGSMYRAKRYSDAVALFAYFYRQSNIVPNVVSYNFLIVAHCENGEVDKALEVYEYVKENAPFGPSSVTFRHLTKGLIDAGRIDEAVDLLWKMVRDGHGADSLVFNNIISGYLDLDNLEKANEFFDELKSKCTVYDGVVTATFMDWFFKKGRTKEALEYYKSLLDKNFKMVHTTGNVLLEVLLKWGRREEADALFDSMLDNHTPPVTQGVNSDTFNVMVNECFKMGNISEAYGVFKKAGKGPRTRPFAMDTAGYNNIITRYCENEMMEDAEKMFEELCSKSLTPDVNTYRTLIDAYFKVGRVDDALEKYVKMVDAGLRVITTYANRWCSELIEKGKLADCATILTKMGEKDPKPDATTYDIVIRALCGIGDYDTSLDLLEQMVRYGVGITPVLKEFALETFEKVGRREDIDCLEQKCIRYAANRLSNGNEQQHGSGTPYGNFSQNAFAPGSRLQYGNGQHHDNGNYHGNGQQHNGGNYYGNGWQGNNRNYYQNTQHHDDKASSGSGPQYDSGLQHGNVPWLNNGDGASVTGSPVINGPTSQIRRWAGVSPHNNGDGHWHNNANYSGQCGSGTPNGNLGQNTHGNGLEDKNENYHGNGLQQHNGNFYGNGQRHNSGNYYGDEWQGNQNSYENAQQYNNKISSGTGQQNDSRLQHGSVPWDYKGDYGGKGQQYDSRVQHADGQRHSNADYSRNGQQYGSRLQYGDEQWRNNGNYSGNAEQYGSRLQNGFGLQFGRSEQYGSGLQNENGHQQLVNGEQYGFEQQQPAEEPQVGTAAA